MLHSLKDKLGLTGKNRKPGLKEKVAKIKAESQKPKPLKVEIKKTKKSKKKNE